MPTITFNLNGKPVTVPYEPGMHFLEVLREHCGVVSAKDGCAPEGTCGCCLVMVDGTPALSCLRKPEQIDGHRVTTVEGLPEATRRALSEAFLLEGGVQCGFCIPGMAMRGHATVCENPNPSREQIAFDLRGHLCRCTGYVKIVDAIETYAKMKRGEASPADDQSGRIGTALKRYRGKNWSWAILSTSTTSTSPA